MGIVTAAEGAGLAGGMLTSEAAGVGTSEASGVAAGSPDGAAVGSSEAVGAGAVGPADADAAGTADAGNGVPVGRGLGEPVGTGVAAGGVAATPVTDGVGESAPGVGMEDEGTGVDVTRASRGTENAYSASPPTSTADVPLCCSRTADGFTASATSGRAPPSSVPQEEASSPGHTRSTEAVLRT